MEIFDITDENGFPTGETVSRSDAHDKYDLHMKVERYISDDGNSERDSKFIRE